MKSIDIRTATIADAASLAELATQLGYPSSSGQITDRLEAILGSHEQVVLVASSSSGRVLGWVHGFIAPRVESDLFAEIGGFVVSDQWRGRGIGRRLLAAVETWAQSRGVSTLRVRSRPMRSGAHAFYEKAGFAKVKEQLVFDKAINSRT